MIIMIIMTMMMSVMIVVKPYSRNHQTPPNRCHKPLVGQEVALIVLIIMIIVFFFKARKLPNGKLS